MKNVPLADGRLTAIASASLDAPAILAPLSVSNITMRRAGNLALFKIGELANGTPVEIPVVIENEQVVFFPERDAGQRDLMAALGIDE